MVLTLTGIRALRHDVGRMSVQRVWLVFVVVGVACSEGGDSMGGDGGAGVVDATIGVEAGEAAADMGALSPDMAPVADAMGLPDGPTVGATGAPMACLHGERDNPYKASVTYTISDLSADANVASKTFTGQMGVLVSYSMGAAKFLTFGFGSSTAPCLRAAVTLFNIDPPATGRMYAVAVSPSVSPVGYIENPACTSDPTMTNSWSLAMPGTLTFSKVDGPNVEMDFSFKMGAKHGGKALGTFTLTGNIKSPCYVIK